MALMLGREAHAFDLHLKIVLVILICHFCRLQTLVMNQSSLNLRNPMLPVSMVMGQSVSAGRLDDPKGKYQIKCLQPGRTDCVALVAHWKLNEVDVAVPCGTAESAGPQRPMHPFAEHRIPIAGKISTMVFDKTGTITKVLPCISPWKLQHLDATWCYQ